MCFAEGAGDGSAVWLVGGVVCIRDRCVCVCESVCVCVCLCVCVCVCVVCVPTLGVSLFPKGPMGPSGLKLGVPPGPLGPLGERPGLCHRPVAYTHLTLPTTDSV